MSSFNLCNFAKNSYRTIPVARFKKRSTKRYKRLGAALCLFVLASGVTASGADRFRLRVDSDNALQWDSASGITYQVEWNDQLVAGNWTPLLTATGTGSQLTFMNPAPTCTSRFYRMGITTPPETLMVAAASGAVRYLQAILDTHPAGTGGLPRDHATTSQLNSNSFPSSDYFVPADLGVWMTAAILGHAYRTSHPNFTVAFDDAALTNYIAANVRAITNILAKYAFVDPLTGGKAFYQVHYTPSGTTPGVGFGECISLMDHGFLVASLHAAALYMERIDTGLADQLRTALTNFNMSMWMKTDGSGMTIGGQNNPRGGWPLNRIMSEGRLAVVTARARNEISENTFAFLLKSMMAQSSPGATKAGRLIQYLSYFGTALELWAVTPYLTPELDTVIGKGVLVPMWEAWEETRLREGLPAAGAAGILTGYNGADNQYITFGLSPNELWGIDTNTHTAGATCDVQVLVLPAAAMPAGAMGSKGTVDNLIRAYHAAQLEGRVHPVFGLSTYLDCGSGLVNEANPVFATLDIGQMAVALLNHLLGGRYLEDILRADAGWNTAFDEYAAIGQYMTRPGESAPSGSGGYRIHRYHAIGTSVWHLVNNAYANFNIPVSVPGECDVVVRYSNDDAGSLDRINVSVNGIDKGSFTTENTKTTNDVPGGGWENYVDSVPIAAGLLPMGTNTVRLLMTQDDGYGVDIDLVSLVKVPSNRPGSLRSAR